MLIVLKVPLNLNKLAVRDVRKCFYAEMFVTELEIVVMFCQ